MAKLIGIPPDGTWSWSDETKTLVFLRSSDNDEITENVKTNLMHTPEFTGKRLERSVRSSALASKGHGGTCVPEERSNIGQVAGNIYLKKYQSDCVTIEHIKEEALSHLQREKSQRIPPHFLSLLRGDALDDFLRVLLLYLSCFFERRMLAKKTKTRMAEQSVTEQQEMVEAAAKLDLALKQLASCYASLILGASLPQHHHMACGRSRTSSTFRDRQFFEWVYSFICYSAWLTFGRKDLLGIQQEVGRLMRSDTFNPALRVRRSGSVEEPICSTSQGEAGVEGHTLPHPHQRRKPEKRPAFSRIVTQCSPLLVALLPSAAPCPSAALLPPTAPPGGACDMEALKEQLASQLASARFGILGTPLHQVSSTTFQPVGEDDEEADEEELEEKEDDE
ncbi:protein phosphatase 1 regulatory subunit 36 isoform X2 [Brienomyrus brachyistius]|uniref:protein phosphatase 1 regulatory subunit 36 isoform X2 n=1 Tax=Brienomyrus brachyistius TaxID=42636 RepID=UPI0020B19180|nr:protein phosphatase 1 regulatory subunit 36 isoform X2 [Brienomyrus brachyistius]